MQSFFGQTGYILEFPLPLSATMVTCYLNEWKHFCRQSLLSIRRLLFIFCLLSHFDFFNVFLCWIATEKKEVKKPFLGARVWAPKPVYRAPKRPGYVTARPNSRIFLGWSIIFITIARIAWCVHHGDLITPSVNKDYCLVITKRSHIL